jgi:serine/threonine-protein kinase RsbW
MATVEMTFTPLPAHVRTARLVATAVARRSGVAEALLDEVRLAVGEACSRAVEVHQAHCPGEPVRVALTGAGKRFEVVVTNTAAENDGVEWPPAGDQSPDGSVSPDPAAPPSANPDPAALPGELGLAVIAGLADEVQVSRTGDGLSIRMSWPSDGS